MHCNGIDNGGRAAGLRRDHVGAAAAALDSTGGRQGVASPSLFCSGSQGTLYVGIGSIFSVAEVVFLRRT